MVDYALDIMQIKSYLPHRYPFLLVDRVLAYEAWETLRAIKNVTVNEPFFDGHFPQKPVMPGVLIVEAMTQSAALLGMLSLESVGKWKGCEDMLSLIVGVDKMRFKHMVLPGDQLVFTAEYITTRQDISRFNVFAYVDDKKVSSGSIMLFMGERS